MSENDNIINLLRDEFRHVNDRLDTHYEMFQKHSEQDTQMFESFREEFKLTGNRITEMETEVKVAKRVGLALASFGTALVGWLGLGK